MGRNDFIHMLRGLAALAVACFHIYGRSHSEPSSQLAAIRSVTEHGYLGVPIFFVISGFVIANSLRDAWVTPRYAGNYALRRSVRLDPPYWVAIIFAIVLRAGIDAMLHNPVELPSAKVLVAHVFYLQNVLNLGNLSMGLWTLCLEVQFYIFMLVLVAFAQRSRVPMACLVTCFGLWALCFSLTVDGDDPAVLTNAYRFLLPNFSMFAIGIFAWMLSTGRLKLWAWSAFQAAIMVRLVIWFQPELLAAWLTGIAITLNAAGRMPVPKIPGALFLGTISYSLYLIHASAANVVILGTVGSEGYNSVLMCTIAIACSILAGWLMYLVIERPSMAFATRLKPAARPGPIPASGHAPAAVYP